ncbi:MAG: ATP-binding protein, partial [Flavobacteriaceae bacterium]|nr:ATP-binding protein [Flavobacteriaceae bacterium]
PESTGKSTLAKKLAEYYNTLWVPEFAREYLQKKWDREKKICALHDILLIAKGQMALENEMASKVNDLLICDTDLLETMVYSQAYFNGECPVELKKYAVENKYDMYFLTYIDVPWIEDDLRDRPNDREKMFQLFENALKEAKKPYTLLKGNIESRMNKCIEIIDSL